MRDSAIPDTSDTSIQEHLVYVTFLGANKAPESELILAKQHTMIQNEEHCLDIASG